MKIVVVGKQRNEKNLTKSKLTITGLKKKKRGESKNDPPPVFTRLSTNLSMETEGQIWAVV